MSLLTFIVSIVGAVLGSSVLTTWINNKYNKPKVDAQAETTLAKTTLEWATVLQKEITGLRDKYDEMSKENRELTIKVAHLERDLEIYKIKYQKAKNESSVIQ